MSRLDSLKGFQPSILDRLIDPDSGGTAARRGYSLEQVRDAIQRDLEELLNTRQSNLGLPEAFSETHRSIVAYGLPDLTSMSALTSQQREEIGRLIEGVLIRFEPRCATSEPCCSTLPTTRTGQCVSASRRVCPWSRHQKWPSTLFSS